MPNLLELPTFSASVPTQHGDKAVRCVVECAMGSPAKLKYDPETQTFELGRPLPKGMTYPFDWGFIPGTLAPDGDPLDVMILHDEPSFPGLVIPSQLVGVLEVEQQHQGKRVRNDRLFAVPVQARRLQELDDVSKLPEQVRRELEQFFIASVALEDKQLQLLGWKGPRVARATLDDCITRRR